jgi:hypothetical protein
MASIELGYTPSASMIKRATRAWTAQGDLRG